MQSGCMGKAAHLVSVKRDEISVSCVFGYMLCFCHGAVTIATRCQEVNSDQTVKDKTLTHFTTIYSFLSFKHLIYHFAQVTCSEPYQLSLTLTMNLYTLCGKCQVPQSSLFRKNSRPLAPHTCSGRPSWKLLEHGAFVKD